MTPPPDKQPAAETLEEIAHNIVTQSRCGPINHDGVAAVVVDVLEGRIAAALRNERERAFNQGYVCAVANIMLLHDQETVARDVLNQNRPDDWSIIDEVDMKALQPIFDHEAAQAENPGS